MICPLCGCEECTLLGSLGTRTHFRCRDCGIDFSELLPRPVEQSPAARKLIADACEATEYFTDDELEKAT